MQPRNIQVFDGLRITTDHLDHLQGAIHSAIGDVREILGLGQIHRGFAVARLDDATVEIGPGVAFDRQRRRVVIDEPVRVAVPALAGSDMRFLCLLYNEVADGEVEGKATRVWDSGTVEVRPAAPSAAEDTIILARLVASAEEGFSVLPPRDEEPEPDVPAAPEVPLAPADTAALAPVSETPARLPDSVVAVAPITVDAASIAAAVEKLAPAIRARLATPADGPVLRERLTTIEAVAGFTLAIVATHGTLAVDCEYQAPPAVGDERLAETSLPTTRWSVETVMHGHAALTQTPVGQCAAGTVQVNNGAGPLYGTTVVMSSAAVLRCVAENASADDAPPIAFFRGLTGSVVIVPRNGDGFGADVWLEWNGTPRDDVAAWLEGVKPAVRCRGMLGWSAQRAAGSRSAQRPE